MIPGSYPLTIYRGDTSRWTFTLWADAAKTQPVNLSGVTVAGQVRVSGGTQSSPAAQMSCAVSLPNVINAGLAVVDQFPRGSPTEWDLQLTWPSGDIQTVLAGPVTILGDVTRAAA